MIGVSKERDVLSNNRRKENVFSNNNSSKRRCDEHWYVNYVAGHHVRYDVFLNDPSAEEGAECTERRDIPGSVAFVPSVEQKKLQAMLNDLAVGDAVVTTSGFYGVVIDITDDDVIVEFGNNKNCRIPMRKTAITEVEKPETAVVEEKTEKKK